MVYAYFIFYLTFMVEAGGPKIPKFTMRFIRHFCLLFLLVAGIQSASAFSLLGPFAPWMGNTNGLGPDWDIGGPMNIGEGYRWNVPLLTYAYDQSFIDFFGTNGVAAVEGAIQILNNLPPASTINLSNYPSDIGQNYFTENLPLDLKSIALGCLLKEMGLASPERYAHCLHDYSILNGVTNYNIVIRNFDPVSLAPSDDINDTEFTYEIFSHRNTLFLEYNQVDPVPGNYSVLGNADAAIGGSSYSGLTYDDAGGVRYLLNSNNIALENLIPGVQGTGTNASNYVTTALRPGIEKIAFLRTSYDPLLGRFFSPITNNYVDTYMTNGTLRHQDLKRVITQPDFLFTAADFLDYYELTDTSSWTKNAQPGSDGPGVIQPPIVISLNRLGPGVFNPGTYPPTYLSISPVWGSFDAPTNFFNTNSVIIYPTTPSGYDFTTFNLQLFTDGGYYDGLKQFSWMLPGPIGNKYLIQTSTNLSDWITITNLTNVGRIFTYGDLAQTNTAHRYFRTVPGN